MKAATLESRKECTINSQHNQATNAPPWKRGLEVQTNTQSTMEQKQYTTTIEIGNNGLWQVVTFTMKDVKAYGNEATVQDYIYFLNS